MTQFIAIRYHYITETKIACLRSVRFVVKPPHVNFTFKLHANNASNF